MGSIGVTHVGEDISNAQRLAARLAARAEIRDVRLMKTSAEILNLPEPASYLAYNLETESAVEHEPGSGSFVVHGTYRVKITAGTSTATDDTNDSESQVARIEFEQAALFTMDMDEAKPPEPEELNAYAVSTGQFVLYPYAREYISDMTMRLGLPPLTIGVLRLPFPDEASTVS